MNYTETQCGQIHLVNFRAVVFLYDHKIFIYVKFHLFMKNVCGNETKPHFGRIFCI